MSIYRMYQHALKNIRNGIIVLFPEEWEREITLSLFHEAIKHQNLLTVKNASEQIDLFVDYLNNVLITDEQEQFWREVFQSTHFVQEYLESVPMSEYSKIYVKNFEKIIKWSNCSCWIYDSAFNYFLSFNSIELLQVICNHDCFELWKEQLKNQVDKVDNLKNHLFFRNNIPKKPISELKESYKNFLLEFTELNGIERDIWLLHVKDYYHDNY